MDSVLTSTAPYLEEPQRYEPFYSLSHGRDESKKRFWYTHRRSSFRKNDNGTEVYISLVDLDFKPALPPVDMLTLRVTCTNRDPGATAEVFQASSASWKRRAWRWSAHAT